jgi:hypothetical protein
MPLLPGNHDEHHGEFMWEVVGPAEVGKLEPRVDPSEYLLSEVGAPHDTVESVTAAGKVVITLS